MVCLCFYMGGENTSVELGECLRRGFNLEERRATRRTGEDRQRGATLTPRLSKINYKIQKLFSVIPRLMSFHGFGWEKTQTALSPPTTLNPNTAEKALTKGRTGRDKLPYELIGVKFTYLFFSIPKLMRKFQTNYKIRK